MLPKTQFVALRATLSLLLLVLAPQAMAQPPQVFSEIAFDDEPPFVGPWFNFYHHGGLGVAAADFDRNGTLDVVVGGNGHVPVRILYLSDPHTTPSIMDIEVLDEANSAATSGGPLTRFKNTQGCYGVDVGDFNEDGWPDIVVTRRKDIDAFVAPLSQRDTIWINDKTSPLGKRYFDDLASPRNLPINSSVEPGVTDEQSRQSFAIAVANVDGATSTVPAHLDLLVAGPFGIRFYRGDGAGNFAHVFTFVDRDPITQLPSSGNYRNITLGDVDNDGDLDLVVTRQVEGDGITASDRVWFNMLNNPFPGIVLDPIPGNPPIELFAWRDSTISQIPSPLQRAPVLGIEWQTLNQSPCPTASGTRATGGGSFDSALGDLDKDGDLDLVVAAPNSNNIAYINNGSGHFGANNVAPSTAPYYNDGLIAYTFVSPTPDWPSPTGYAASECLVEKLKYLLKLAFPGGPPGCYEFRVPGKLIDFTTSCRIADVNGDGFQDVVFANRTDFQDGCLNVLGLPYFNPITPAPEVFDYVYFGRSVPAGQISFCSFVEAVGVSNDGTSYIEMIRIGARHGIDWIESNFDNAVITLPDGSDYVTLPQESIPGHPLHGNYLDYPQNYPGQGNGAVIFGQSFEPPFACPPKLSLP